MTLIEIKNYAIKCHMDTNHLYDGKPYEVHLEIAASMAKRFIHLIPKMHQDIVVAAVWCHDLIEDCRVSYSDLKADTHEQVADIVYAVTNEKGKNRRERANDKYYYGIRNTKYAVFVKLCDRLANIHYSNATGNSKKLKKYRKEAWGFVYSLLKPDNFFVKVYHLLIYIFRNLNPKEYTVYLMFKHDYSDMLYLLAQDSALWK